MAVEYGRPLRKIFKIGGGGAGIPVKGHIRGRQRVEYQDQNVGEAAASLTVVSVDRIKQRKTEAGKPSRAEKLDEIAPRDCRVFHG